MTKILQLILLLLTIPAGYAQIVFEKGYFIDNSGTKIECLIKNEDWRDNPIKFEYKETENSEAKTGVIAKIQEFGIDNISKYKRFTGKIEKSSVLTGKLGKNKSPNFFQETLFLKTLLEGDANLYAYTLGTISKFFFSTKNSPIEQLVYIRYSSENGDAAENNQFRQQLFNNVKCEKAPESSIVSLKYEKNDLIKHFERFNRCNGFESVKFEREKTKNPFVLRVLLGAASTSVSTEGIDIEGANIKKTIAKYGIEAEYILPFNKNSWSIFLAPQYYTFNGEENYHTAGLYGQPVPKYVEVDYKTLEIPFGVRRYFFLNLSSKFYIDVAYVIQAAEKGTITFKNFTSPTLNSERTIDLASNGELAIGLGYNYKKIGIGLKVNTGRDLLSEYNYMSATFKNITANLSYQLF